MKKMLTVVLAVMLGGVALMWIGLAGMDYDLEELDTNKYTFRNETITEPFDTIRLTGTTANVEISVTKDPNAMVTGNESEMYPLEIRVEDGALVISQGELQEENWLKNIFGKSFLLKNRRILVTVPEKVYENLRIRMTTGDVTVSPSFEAKSAEVSVTTGDVRIDGTVSDLNVQATTGTVRINGQTDRVEVRTTTGRITLNDMTPETVSASATTGDIRLSGVDAGELNCQATTGSIRLTNCDGRKLNLKTTTGQIHGTLLSGKTFKASSVTGSVRCPEDSGEDLCTASTTTGKIWLQVVQETP